MVCVCVCVCVCVHVCARFPKCMVDDPERNAINTRHPKTKFSAQRRFIFLGRTKGRELETRTGDRGNGRRGREQGRDLHQRDKGLPLDREETDMAHRQMVVYKGKRGNPMLG